MGTDHKPPETATATPGFTQACLLAQTILLPLQQLFYNRLELIVDCLCTTEAFGWVTFMIDKGRL
jgi:hypothetical protein